VVSQQIQHGLYRLVVSAPAGLRDGLRRFPSVLTAQSRVAETVLLEADAADISAVRLQRRDGDEWTDVRTWGRDVVERILRQSGRSLVAAAVEPVDVPLVESPLAEPQPAEAVAPPVVAAAQPEPEPESYAQPLHRPTRWGLIAAAAFALIVLAVLIYAQTGGQIASLVPRSGEDVRSELPWNAQAFARPASDAEAREP
jgi:hypothetical protein